MASFLVTGLALSGYLLARQPQKKYDRKLRSILFLYATPIITIPLLLVLASRTGWLSAILVVLMLLPYLFRFSTKKRLTLWSLSIGTGLLLGTLITAQSGQSDFIAQKADLESPRSYTFPQALDMFIEKPFTGYGYGNFESQYILYTARQHQLNHNYPPGLPAMDHPHNETLFWSVEGGIVPLIGILLAAAFVLHRIYTAKKGTRIALFALLIPIFIHSQLEYPFYHSAIHWITFILLIYWVDQRTAKYKKANFTKITHTFLRVSSLLFPLITVVFMLTSLQSNHVLTQFEASKPKNPDILNRVTNHVAWEDRLDWNIQSTLLNVGLATSNSDYINSYVDWQLPFIKHKPRPAFYQNLLLAYHALDEQQKYQQILKEAQFLFPERNIKALVEGAISASKSITQSEAESPLSSSSSNN
jgi:O-antigen polymerase